MNPEGVIVGGWQYVWMAYGLTAASFVVYGITLVTRLREAKRKLNGSH